MSPKNIYAPGVQRKRRQLCANTPILTRTGVRFVSQVCVLCAASACAKQAQTPSEEPFHRIQEHEASIALGNEELRATTECEAARAAAEQRVCGSSEALCLIARDLNERDAQSRCLLANDACTGARERAQRACATNQPRDDGAKLGR